VLALLLTGWVSSGCTTFGADSWSGPVSDHFDGERFFNPGVPDKSFSDFLRWQWTSEAAEWPKWIESTPGPKPPERVRDHWRVTFINHATVLIQMHGINILTDPTWSERASPVSWAGPKRVRAPGIRFEDLPPIDAVLLSHNHYDHMDLATLQKLHAAFKPVIFTGLGNASYLAERGVPGAVDMDWWDKKAGPGGLNVHFVPAQHFSARSFTDRNRTLWGGLVIDAPDGRLFFAGDSGYGPHFREIGERLGPFRFALIPIGAYEPRWFMKMAHVNPEEAVRAHQEVRSEVSLGIHFGTFQLTDEPIDAPIEALSQALRSMQVDPTRFITLTPGDAFEVKQTEQGPSAHARQSL
jgi:L-ascorbate metabolism protein UlaG (beta-lactamase superfamily)